MAVVINKSVAVTNTGDANGFWRVESYQLSTASSSIIGLDAQYPIPVTFANAGTCLGVGFSLYSSSSAIDRNLRIQLQEVMGTCTISVASPGVVTFNSHGLAPNDVISFSTTGALPTGLTATATYYVKTVLTANTFTVSATAGGSVINTSGTQSGTHSLWRVRIDRLLSKAETTAYNPTTGSIYGINRSFDFTEGTAASSITATSYAVDTTANKWRFTVGRNGGTTGSWSLMSSSATTYPTYWTWCNTQLSLSSGDTLIVNSGNPTTTYRVNINSNVSLNGVLSTGDSTNGYALKMGSNVKSFDADNVSCLTWDSSPASSYTFTVNACVEMQTHCGIRIGTSTNPIPFSKQAKFVFALENVGTTASKFITHGGVGVKPSLFMFGEVPTNRMCTLTNDVAIGASSFTATGDVSNWVNGDEIAIGKCDVIGQGDTTLYTVSSVSGQTVNFTPNLATNIRKAGGHVVNFNRYGVRFESTRTNGSSHAIYHLSNFQFKGVYFINISFSNASTSNVNVADPDRVEWFVEDCSVRYTTTSVLNLISNSYVPSTNFRLERNYCFRGALFYSVYAYYGTNWKSNRVIQKDNVIISLYSGGLSAFATVAMCKVTTSGNIIENSRNSAIPGVIISGLDLIAEDNTIWGYANVNTSGGAMAIRQTINSNSIKNNKIDKSICGIAVDSFVTVGVNAESFQFGSEAANTEDIYFNTDSLIDFTMDTPTGISTITTSNLPLTLNGSKFRIINYNNTPMDDRVYATFGNFQRCGTGLADTTQYGINTYSLRLEPTTSTDPLEFEQNGFPIGNCQNKEVTVIAYIKINSANYWSGTSQLPRVTITYDETSTAYVQAAQQTGWQRLAITFTPQTTFGAIDISINGFTDQIGSDAYFYIGQFSIQYPAGSTLNLGGLDYWSKSLPVTPMFATLLSPKDIADALWDDDLADHTIAGSFGKKVADDLTLDDFIGLGD